MNLYIRETELFVGSKHFKKPLTIEFDVAFDDSEKVNETEISIYNLLDSTIKSLKKGQRVVLNTGYSSDIGNVFIGTLKKQVTERQGVDKITKLTCIDDQGNYLSKKVSKTYKANTKASTILPDLIRQTNLTLAEMKLPRDFVYKSGKTVYGKLGDQIRAISRDCLAKVHINKNKIFIRDKNKGDNIGFDLKAETGLLEVSDIEKEVNGKSKAGYKVVSLLNHRITVDSIIKLTSKKANGLFRVEKGKHNGSSFLTEMEVYPV